MNIADLVTACLDARAWMDAVDLRSPRDIVARVDARRLDVMVSNLVGNALRHGGSPVTVVIRREPRAGRPGPARRAGRRGPGHRRLGHRSGHSGGRAAARVRPVLQGGQLAGAFRGQRPGPVDRDGERPDPRRYGVRVERPGRRRDVQPAAAAGAAGRRSGGLRPGRRRLRRRHRARPGRRSAVGRTAVTVRGTLRRPRGALVRRPSGRRAPLRSRPRAGLGRRRARGAGGGGARRRAGGLRHPVHGRADQRRRAAKRPAPGTATTAPVAQHQIYPIREGRPQRCRAATRWTSRSRPPGRPGSRPPGIP
ncbi:hypothetical protein ACU686_28435 [Yinghuangia aomiensis]